MNNSQDSGVDLDRNAILAEVGKIVVDVVGIEYLGDVEITMKTVFESDLGFESIDIVVLAERLKERYGDRLRLEQWWKALLAKEITDAAQVSVGDLVDFVVVCLSEPETA
jgi:acyl carrier protein